MFFRRCLRRLNGPLCFLSMCVIVSVMVMICSSVANSRFPKNLTPRYSQDSCRITTYSTTTTTITPSTIANAPRTSSTIAGATATKPSSTTTILTPTATTTINTTSTTVTTSIAMKTTSKNTNNNTASKRSPATTTTKPTLRSTTTTTKTTSTTTTATATAIITIKTSSSTTTPASTAINTNKTTSTTTTDTATAIITIKTTLRPNIKTSSSTTTPASTAIKTNKTTSTTTTDTATAIITIKTTSPTKNTTPKRSPKTTNATATANTNTKITTTTTTKRTTTTAIATTTTKITSTSATAITTTTTKTTPKPTTTTPRPCNYTLIEEFITDGPFVCSSPIGGLGNRLFVYASAYGIASAANRTLLLDDDNLLLKYFNISATLVPGSEYYCLLKNYTNKHAKHDCSFDPKMFDLPEGNTKVGTYMQSYKYFEHVTHDIIREFSLRQTFLDKARKIIDKSLSVYFDRTNSSNRPVLIGVHIRRGNFINNSYGYDVASPEYMNKSTEYFRDKYDRVLFLVCSNGMDWAKKNIQGDDVVYIEGNDYITDMALLVSCDHIISSVGSFSWWAGYLAGGEVVYYQWPAKKGTELRKHYSEDFMDFFPPSWIGMS